MRTIEISLNKFSTIPPSLADVSGSCAVKSVQVKLGDLFHHYYIAKYGNDNGDNGNYEYQDKLTPDPDWRFQGTGIGADKEAKRNVSNELGKAFARWFLYTHLKMTYFCPLEDIFRKVNSDGSRWERTCKGDLPDYVCGKNQLDVNLLEAKGRYCSVGFATKAFGEFREQLQRIRLLDGGGNAIRVKGFISAARWATAENHRIKSKLFVEDPYTDGTPREGASFPAMFGHSMVAGHYVSILSRLQLPLHAEALRSRGRFTEGKFRRGVWECISGALSGRKFVGGIIADRLMIQCCPLLCDKEFIVRFWNSTCSPFFLTPSRHFFGVEEKVLRQVLNVVKTGINNPNIAPIDTPGDIESLSLFRDGSILGIADHFKPVGVIEV